MSAPLLSMTGSVSVTGHTADADFTLDLTSVNHRYLEIALQMPEQLRHLEGQVREHIGHALKRGSISCLITLTPGAQAFGELNEDYLHALLGAYSPAGARWVDELKAVLYGNLCYVKYFMEGHFPGVSMFLPEGTYMLFLNCRDWCEAHHVPMDELLRRGVRAGVIWQRGADFGAPDCIRLNVALPSLLVEEAMQRLKERVFVD